MKRIACGSLTLALLLGGIGQAKADLGVIFTGTIYENLSVTSPALLNPTVGLTPSADHATFMTSPLNGISLNYAATDNNTINPVNTGPAIAPLPSPGAYTPNGFYRSPGFTNVSGAFSAGGNLNLSYTSFTGFVNYVAGTTLVFKTYHDDGIQLKVGSTTFASTGNNTGNEIYTYSSTVSNSNLEIDLAYAEDRGAPAVLQLGITATPEPATLTMAGIGLVAFGGYKLRRRMRVVA